jgi:hypothetical protein
MDRFLEVARKDLGEVRLLNARDRFLESAPLQAELPDGRFLVVVTTPEANDLEAIASRLELLLDCFADTLEALAPITLPRRRPPATEALCLELRALTKRTDATDAFIIDIDSPVVWCSAEAGPATDSAGQPLTREARIATVEMRRPKLKLVGKSSVANEKPNPAPEPSDDDDDDSPRLPVLTLKAIERLRALPELEPMRQGKRLRHSIHEPGFGLLSRSVAQIYVLSLVFDGEMSELPSERALTAVLPRVERLIQSLPPIDPSPGRGAKVSALRPGLGPA